MWQFRVAQRTVALLKVAVAALEALCNTVQKTSTANEYRLKQAARKSSQEGARFGKAISRFRCPYSGCYSSGRVEMGDGRELSHSAATWGAGNDVLRMRSLIAVRGTVPASCTEGLYE